jgi:hypothetical protein
MLACFQKVYERLCNSQTKKQNKRNYDSELYKTLEIDFSDSEDETVCLTGARPLSQYDSDSDKYQ